MPISSGASGRRPPSRPPPPAAARSTPNLTQQQQQQQQPVGRMIDAPPKVEARRQLGSQTLYGSKPPWATDDDAPQPPFYPPGGDLQHGEVTRMRRIKAARQIYKSPQSRDRHTTGSVDDLLRDCAISDHSHSPSPVRRAPSASSELQASDSSRPNTRSISIGTDTMDNYRSEPDLTRRGRHRRGRKNYDDDDDDESVSDDSLDGGGGRSGGRARSSSRGRGRHRARTESRGTSPPPQPPPPFRARPMPDFSRPLYVSTGGDGQPSPHSNQQQQRANGYGRTKMPAGLKPASERRYVPPPPPQQPPAPPIPKHDSSSCLPGDSPPFKARRMPDFSGGANPAPLRHPRSRSQSPAAAKGARQRPAAAAATPIATTTAVNNSSATSGYSSSPQRQRRERRRSMDEDSLTDVGSVREAASVSTEVLRPQRTAKADTRMAAADAVDSALRNLERQQLPKPQRQGQQQRQQQPAPQRTQSSVSGRSSILLVPEKVFKDRSMTDIDLDEIFGTGQQQQQLLLPQHPPEVNERIQYWLKKNIYFHACEPTPLEQQQNQQQAKYGSSPPNPETLRSMTEHRPAQPQMEIIVQRCELAVNQLPPASNGRSRPRHVSTVEYPVRKFHPLPYGYLSPSSSEGDEEQAKTPVGTEGQEAPAEILRQAVLYARSTAADPGSAGDATFWYAAKNGPTTVFSATAPPQSVRQQSVLSSPAGSTAGQGRVRALASRFAHSPQQPPQQQPQQQRPDSLPSQQPGPASPAAPGVSRGGATPDLVRSTHLQEINGVGRFAAPPVVTALQLRRATQQLQPVSDSSASDSKTFYFGDKSLVSKREHREHWASGYFNRPNLEIIDREGVNGAGQ